MWIKQFIIEVVWNSKFYRFLLVGVVNTVFGYSIFSLFVLLGMHYSIATLIATIVGVLFNYRTTGSLVFRNKSNKLLLKFIGVYAVVYLVNIVGIKILSVMQINIFLAGALLVIPVAFLSFVLNKKFVFEVEK